MDADAPLCAAARPTPTCAASWAERRKQEQWRRRRRRLVAAVLLLEPARLGGLSGGSSGGGGSRGGGRPCQICTVHSWTEQLRQRRWQQRQRRQPRHQKQPRRLLGWIPAAASVLRQLHWALKSQFRPVLIQVVPDALPPGIAHRTNLRVQALVCLKIAFAFRIFFPSNCCCIQTCTLRVSL